MYITIKYCEPCRKCILQAYFSHFLNPHLEEAEYLEFNLLNLEDYINPRDIYNFPPDVPKAVPFQIIGYA